MDTAKLVLAQERLPACVLIAVLGTGMRWTARLWPLHVWSAQERLPTRVATAMLGTGIRWTARLWSLYA
jgi:hypothetical protein